MPVEFSGGNSGTVFIPEFTADPVSPAPQSGRRTDLVPASAHGSHRSMAAERPIALVAP